jgi:putative transport protein
MNWIATTLTRSPGLAVFVVSGAGYWIGAFKLKRFSLGAVTGSLLAGLLAAVVSVPVSSTAKSLLVRRFLFSVGYSVRPKFFQAMKGAGCDGRPLP